MTTETNTYTYDNQVLSGPGTVEHLVRSGMIADPTGVMQPRSVTTIAPEYATTSITVVNLPEPQKIPDFDKRKVLIWETRTQYGREYLTYDGTWVVEYLGGYREEALEYRVARMANDETKDTIEREFPDGGMLFEFSKEDSQVEYTRRGLDLALLRNNYDNVQEITPEFTEMKRDVKGDTTAYFLVHTLKEHEEEVQSAADMKLFDANDDKNNPLFFFGGRLTGQDIGFYIDKGNRLRATYDPSALFRSKPLLDDLIAHGTPDDYVAATYPTGTVQFVVSRSLTEKLLAKFSGSHDALARRYNDETRTYKDFKPSDYPQFEDTLDVETGQFKSASETFGISTDEEKK